MFKATEAIEAKFKEKGIGCEVKETEKSTRVMTQWNVENGPSYRLEFISQDDDFDVAVRVFALVHVKDEKKEAILQVLNRANNVYRYTKFILDEDNDVNVAYDLPVKTEEDDVGEVCMEIMLRFIKIIDEVYPMIMKELWA